MRYNIIGDVHSRKCWKEVVKDDCINVFVGDYFAPYHNVPFDEQMEIYMDIVKYKTEHPETIMLIGNHDDQHWKNVDRHCSRFNYSHFQEIEQVFKENDDYMQVAYSIENKILVTHAGVNAKWFFRYYFGTPLINYFNLDREGSLFSDCKNVTEAANLLVSEHKTIKFKDGDIVCFKTIFYKFENDKWIKIDLTIDEIAETINNWWNDNKKLMAFNFSNNCDYVDTYGTSDKQGCMWIRPETLIYNSILAGQKDKYQVVGHTQFGKVINYENIYFVDCLETVKQSLIIDIDGDNIKFDINNKTDELLEQN